MTFDIRMGVPDMAAFNDEITAKARANTLDRDEKKLFRQWRKALGHLAQNPRHPGLRTHEIEPLSARFGQKVFQSYLNQGDTADRFYWVYGPGRGDITVVGLEPHPEDRKRGGYERVSLSGLPDEGLPRKPRS